MNLSSDIHYSNEVEKMRACIIAANNIRYSPYIFFYTKILDSIGVQYELIVPNRNGIQEEFEKPLHVLPWDQNRGTLQNYITYTNRVKKKLHKGNFDITIVLTGVIAAFLGLWLKRNYSGRYIVDIRDYSHENIYPYFFLEKKAVENSLMNVISSQRFTAFLPKAQYYVCHNTNVDTSVEKHFFQRAEEPVRIGYVGSLFYAEQCKKLMQLVSKDKRFRFDFYGTSDQESILKEAANELQTDRIAFHGAYEPKQKGEIIRKVDILFNAYGNGCQLLDCALSNKLYDALIYRKPILTSPDTYMTEMAGPLAFPIDMSDDKALEKLYNWYQKIDGQEADSYAARMLDNIVKENSETKRKIADCILGLARLDSGK